LYSAYPHKVGRGAALKAYRQARKKTGKAELLDAVRRFAAAKARDGTEKRFIPHPATWLNGERWADEASPGRGAPAPIASSGYQGRNPADFDREDWRVRLTRFRENGAWAEHWGARPPDAVPVEELIDRYVAFHRRSAA
jgi:hypothetical protein